MRRVVSYIPGVAFTLTAASMLTAIVVLAANDPSMERDHGSGPGFALIMILKG